MGLDGQCHTPATTHGGDQVPIVQEAGWAPAWVLLHRILNPEPAACEQVTILTTLSQNSFVIHQTGCNSVII